MRECPLCSLDGVPAGKPKSGSSSGGGSRVSLGGESSCSRTSSLTGSSSSSNSSSSFNSNSSSLFSRQSDGGNVSYNRGTDYSYHHNHHDGNREYEYHDVHSDREGHDNDYRNNNSNKKTSPPGIRGRKEIKYDAPSEKNLFHQDEGDARSSSRFNHWNENQRNNDDFNDNSPNHPLFTNLDEHDTKPRIVFAPPPPPPPPPPSKSHPLHKSPTVLVHHHHHHHHRAMTSSKSPKYAPPKPKSGDSLPLPPPPPRRKNTPYYSDTVLIRKSFSGKERCDVKDFGNHGRNNDNTPIGSGNLIESRLDDISGNENDTQHPPSGKEVINAKTNAKARSYENEPCSSALDFIIKKQKQRLMELATATAASGRSRSRSRSTSRSRSLSRSISPANSRGRKIDVSTNINRSRSLSKERLRLVHCDDGITASHDSSDGVERVDIENGRGIKQIMNVKRRNGRIGKGHDDDDDYDVAPRHQASSFYSVETTQASNTMSSLSQTSRSHSDRSYDDGKGTGGGGGGSVPMMPIDFQSRGSLIRDDRHCDRNHDYGRDFDDTSDMNRNQHRTPASFPSEVGSVNSSSNSRSSNTSVDSNSHQSHTLSISSSSSTASSTTSTSSSSSSSFVSRSTTSSICASQYSEISWQKADIPAVMNVSYDSFADQSSQYRRDNCQNQRVMSRSTTESSNSPSVGIGRAEGATNTTSKYKIQDGNNDVLRGCPSRDATTTRNHASPPPRSLSTRRDDMEVNSAESGLSDVRNDEQVGTDMPTRRIRMDRRNSREESIDSTADVSCDISELTDETYDSVEEESRRPQSFSRRQMSRGLLRSEESFSVSDAILEVAEEDQDEDEEDYNARRPRCHRNGGERCCNNGSNRTVSDDTHPPNDDSDSEDEESTDASTAYAHSEAESSYDEVEREGLGDYARAFREVMAARCEGNARSENYRLTHPYSVPQEDDGSEEDVDEEEDEEDEEESSYDGSDASDEDSESASSSVCSAGESCSSQESSSDQSHSASDESSSFAVEFEEASTDSSASSSNSSESSTKESESPTEANRLLSQSMQPTANSSDDDSNGSTNKTNDGILVGINTCEYDKRGRCVRHPHVRLRKRRVMGGWKVLMNNCTACCFEEVQRLRLEYKLTKEYYLSQQTKGPIASDADIHSVGTTSTTSSSSCSSLSYSTLSNAQNASCASGRDSTGNVTPKGILRNASGQVGSQKSVRRCGSTGSGKSSETRSIVTFAGRDIVIITPRMTRCA